MIKVMTIFGTRPEAIKMAPLVKELEKDEDIKSIVCVTAQHREMLDQVLDLFEIKPDYDLNIMARGQTLSDITNRVLKGVEAVLQEAKPDMVLVHGDTTTTLAGALASFYAQIPVGHVEAGLRSGNIYSPFPEEMNRSLTGRMASIHFAATDGNVANLIKEGIESAKIVKTGNTVIDALKMVIKEDYIFADERLNQIDYKNTKTILMTAHRRENLGAPMENIFGAVKEIVDNNEDVRLIFPLHLNPAVREIAYRYLSDNERIILLEPLDYEPFANLQAKVDLILTDSGGIQEEAPALGKPVVVLRTETERPEAVDAGTVVVVGVDKEKIIKITDELINDKEAYLRMSEAVNPYGDGSACPRIVKAIKTYFSNDIV